MHVKTLCVAAAAIASSAHAHHGAANYDLTKEVVIEGTIAKVDWKNPHIYITLAVPGDQGEVAQQEIEGGSISLLSPLGLERDSLALGERITVRARPHRRGQAYAALGIDATTADGSVVPLNVSAARERAPSSAVASSIAGRWLGSRRAFLDLDAAAPSWPMTEKGRGAFTGNSWGADCVASGAPEVMFRPVLIHIAIDAKTVVIELDWMGVRRVIHLDVTEHPADLEPSLFGHSVGRFERDALVIDTVGFAEHRQGIGFGLPSGLGKHTVERLSLAADRRHLDYEITTEDPEYLMAPIHNAAQWEYRPELEPSGAECNLESARRFLQEQADQ